MTERPILESGMTFGPFPKGHCFYIEKSETYRKVQKGVRMAEFLLLRFKDGKAPVIWIVEAKSSTPHPATQPNFDDFIAGVREKLINAFFLGVATILKRHQTAVSELPSLFQSLSLSSVGFRFVLVINEYPEDRLRGLQEVLAKSLHPVVKTWRLPPASVAVLNEKSARQNHLIFPEPAQ